MTAIDTLRLVICDSKTGQVYTIDPEKWPIGDEQYWTDGNGICDCNRGIACGVYQLENAPCGEVRFVLHRVPWDMSSQIVA